MLRQSCRRRCVTIYARDVLVRSRDSRNQSRDDVSACVVTNTRRKTQSVQTSMSAGILFRNSLRSDVEKKNRQSTVLRGTRNSTRTPFRSHDRGPRCARKNGGGVETRREWAARGFCEHVLISDDRLVVSIDCRPCDWSTPYVVLSRRRSREYIKDPFSGRFFVLTVYVRTARRVDFSISYSRAFLFYEKSPVTNNPEVQNSNTTGFSGGGGVKPNQLSIKQRV